MKLWTAEHQRQLDVLIAIRQNANDRLSDDVAALVKDYDEYAAQVMSAFLTKYGQQVLDMLLKHFDPSGMPTPVQQPGNWQNLADAVALSKHG